MLFTILLEFEGINSVSQFSASDPDAAVRLWVHGLSKPMSYGFHQAETVAKALEAHGRQHRAVNEALGIDKSELAPLGGVRNVWCLMGSGEKPALLNIVATIP